MRVRANAAGEIDLNLHELTGTSWGDGWSPANTHRIGYDDHDEFNWDIMGSFNAWAAPLVELTDQGNGLHTGSFTIDTPGSYDFKFRQAGDWNTSIGADFGNGAANAMLTSTTAGEVWNFELDLPNGRWRAYTGAASLGAAVPRARCDRVGARLRFSVVRHASAASTWTARCYPNVAAPRQSNGQSPLMNKKPATA